MAVMVTVAFTSAAPCEPAGHTCGSRWTGSLPARPAPGRLTRQDGLRCGRWTEVPVGEPIAVIGEAGEDVSHIALYRTRPP
jgi:hypothetical protein